MKFLYPRLSILLLSTISFFQLSAQNCNTGGGDCADAIPLCVNNYGGRLTDNPDPPDPFPGCPSNVIDNATWHRFTPIDANFDISINNSGCVRSSGVQAGVYSSCNFSDPALAVFCSCTTGPINFTVTGLNPGEEYFIMIDGCAGDVCDYTIDIVGEIEMTGGGDLPTKVDPPFGDPLEICPGITGTYEVDAGTGGILFDWSVPSGATITNQDCETIDVLWGNNGGFITVDVTYQDPCDPTLTTTITSDPLEIILIEPEGEDDGFYCERTPPYGYIYPGDGLIYTCGEHEIVLMGASVQGCDSTVTLTVDCYLPEDEIIVEELCPGECVEIGGVEFCDPISSFDMTLPGEGAFGCDSFLNITINPLFPQEEWVTEAICIGDCIFVEGEEFCGPTFDYPVVLEGDALNGCDRIVYVTIEVLSPFATIDALDPGEVNCETVAQGGLIVTADAFPSNVTYDWYTEDGLFDIIIDDIISVRAGGTYVLTITQTSSTGDVFCSFTDSITILENREDPDLTFAESDLSCHGANDGSATVTPSGGVTPYTYSWSVPGNTPTIDNLAPGWYTVTVTTSNSCSSIDSVLVEEPDEIQIQLTGVDALCNAGNTGSATSTIMGGNTPYTYQWSANANNQTTPDATNLQAGTFTLVVTDANGCSESETVTIDQPLALTASFNLTHATCANANTGAATVTVSNGTDPLTYNWTGSGSTTATANDLVAGNYTVLVTDANGCTVEESFTITQPDELTGTASANDANCFNSATGSATASPGGGTTPYTYLWDAGAGNQTTATANNLSQGTYTVVITDANGCTTETSATIDQPEEVTLVTSFVNALCDGSNDGSATVSPSGGITPYTYLWDPAANAQTSATANSLTAGTYTVLVTDNNGCTSTASVTVDDPSDLEAQVDNTTDVLCFGENTGQGTISGSGGTQPYTYQWPASANNQITSTATGLNAGNYTPTITDANGCTEVVSLTIDEPPVLSSQASAIAALCNGTNTGSASVTGNGGVTPYTYNWSAGTNNGDNATDLGPGLVSVTITDANGCTTVASATVGQPTELTAVTSGTDALCNAATDGAATVTPGGGTTPYTFLWDPNANNQSTATANSLGAGSYTVLVTDANGCTTIASVSIDDPEEISLTTSDTDALCNTSADGSAAVSASGGSTPYTFLWDTNARNQGTATANGLSSGTYTVLVTDANGCTNTASVTVDAPTQLTLNEVDANDAKCFGNPDGDATIAGSGGTTPYTYQWPATAGGQNTAQASGLRAATYQPTVTDANGCTAVVTITIDEPTLLEVQATGSDVLCNSDTNGTASATGSGGTTPYTFNWSAGTGAGGNVSGLQAGTVTVTITDANGCTNTATAIVNEPTALEITSLVGTDPLCNGASNGAGTVQVNGGTSPYTYAWSGSTNVTNTVSDLLAGPQTVTVTDANGCSIIDNFDLGEPDELIPAIDAVTDALCAGSLDGTASGSATGGTAPYTYTWSPGTPNGSTVGSLPAGTVTLVVTDANGCSNSVDETIGQPDPLDLTMSAADALCKNQTDGNASVVVSGGTLPYTYRWSDGNQQIDADAINLGSGTYTVTVTDGNGCTAENNIFVGEPADELSATGTTQDASCGSSNGSITVTGSGGTAPYTFDWADGSSGPTNDGLAPGNYRPTVTDANGCTFVLPISVSTPDQFETNPSFAAVDCFGQSTGSILSNVTGGTAPYTYNWNPASGNIPDLNNVPAGTYELTVTDATGCELITSVEVTQPTPIEMVAQSSVASCGESDGSINISPSGGTAPYTFRWSDTNGTTTQNLSSVPAGLYTVTITDANGCTFEKTEEVINPNGPEINDVQFKHLDCFEDESGNITVDIIGGTTPYTYTWNQAGLTGPSVSNLPAGNYEVTVTDSKKCEIVQQVTITEPSLLVVTDISSTPAVCGATNGTASVTVDGGTTPYTYDWSSGDQIPNPNNLAAGNYFVTVTDQNGCTVIADASTVPADAVQISEVVAPALCNGSQDGSITITLNGGVMPFTFNWNYNSATTQSLDNLPAGTYILTVTDGDGCTYENNYTINQPGPIEINSVVTDATCGPPDGAISLDVQGGTTPYTYLWSNGSIVKNPENLAADDYTVTVTDQNGCTFTHERSVGLPDGPVASVQRKVDAQCKDATDGIIELSVTNGNPPYTYNWSVPGVGDVSMNDELGAGPVSITITDSKSCEIIVNELIDEPEELLLNDETINQATCGNPNGSISVVMEGGTAPYTYSWSPTLSNTPSPSNLSSGTYNLTVTDAQGCTYVDNFNVSTPGELEASVLRISDVLCFGGNDGEVEVEAMGGTAPYTYEWSIPGIGDQPLASNLPTGNYIVDVTDANGCTVTVPAFVNQPPVIETSVVDVTEATCNTANGAIDVKVEGGSPPYTFAWDNGANPVEDPDGLRSGTYNMTVTDSHGCTATQEANVSEPGAVILSTAIQDANCNGESNGGITLITTAGRPPFTFQWNDSNNSTTQDISNLPAGRYEVTVTDQDGCQYFTSATIEEPAILFTASTTPLGASCNGGNDGALTLTTTGGTEPYTYTWSDTRLNGDDAPSSLSAGNYTVTVTDAHGCTYTESWVINEPTALALSLTADDADCFGANDGSITSLPTGGIAPYTYIWSDQSTDPNNDTLVAGIYDLTVTDNNGCTIVASTAVDHPAEILLQITDVSKFGIYNVSCSDSDDGYATVQAQGSIPPFTYTWDNGTSGPTAENLVAGTNTVTVTDSNGCSQETSVVLTSPEPLEPAMTPVSPTCFDYSNGLIYLESVNGGTAPFLYSIDGGPFGVRPDFRNLNAGTYIIAVQDANGCEWSVDVALDNPEPFVIDAGPDQTIEYGDSIQLEPSAVSGTIVSFSWNDTSLVDFVNWVKPVESSRYTITALNDKNCRATDDVKINIEKPRRVFIPNVFSPGSDNDENKIFTIFTGKGVKSIKTFSVFNRWGEVIHQIKNPDGQPVNTSGFNAEIGWDGTFNGEMMNPAVFVYYAEVEFNDGEVKTYSGDVTLVR